MKRAMLAACLLFGAGAAEAQNATAPGAGAVADSKPAITGSVEERNAAIRKLLGEEGCREIFSNGQHLVKVMHYITDAMEFPVEVDWPALEKAGLSGDLEMSFGLATATREEMLQAICWLMRTKTGFVGYVIQEGKVKVGPRATPMPPLNDEATRAHNKETELTLKDEVDWGRALGGGNSGSTDVLKESPLDVHGTHASAAIARLHQVMGEKRIGLLIDWNALEAAGVKPDTPLAVEYKDKSAEEYLKAVITAMKPTKGTIAYRVQNGAVLISTESVFEAETATRPTDH